MRRLILLLLVSLCAGQTGPHRKVFSSVAINCTNFASTGIIETATNGNIFWSGGMLSLSLTTTFLTGDIIEVVVENDSGQASAIPSVVDVRGLTWNPLVTNLAADTTSRGIWYGVAGTGFTGDTITVNFHTSVSFSVQYSISAVHIGKGFIPSFIAPSGNTGFYPTTPTFTLNASTVIFGSTGSVTSTPWIFGGVAIPSTATYLHGLIITSIAGGASYNGTPPAGWNSIIVAGFPSSGIFYSCSFP